MLRLFAFSVLLLPSRRVQEEIGYIDYLKAHSSKWNNLKEAIVNAPKEQQDAIRKKSMAPDFWVSSITALSEEGDFVRLQPLQPSQPPLLLILLRPCAT